MELFCSKMWIVPFFYYHDMQKKAPVEVPFIQQFIVLLYQNIKPFFRSHIENSGKFFESSRSFNQNLTFDMLAREMQIRNIEFNSPQKRTLKLIGEDGLYTNLAYLLSEQCETTTKVALFQGTDKAVFRDRKEFTGSILKQLEEAYQYINLNNKTKATFSGLNRVDTRDYPEEAVREALLNSIVHRDYFFSGSNLINLSWCIAIKESKPCGCFL